jgi:zinc transport system substrate-binding protein
VRNSRAWWWSLAAFLATLAPSSVDALPRVFVGVAPLRSMVQTIAGSTVVVDVLLPTGAAPSTFEPRARQLARLAEADVLFTVGLPFEEVLARRLAKGSAGGKAVSLMDGEASMGGPHAWLDPLALVAMAETCADWFGEYAPDSAAVYDRRAGRLATSYRALDEELRARVQRLGVRSFVTVHPAYSAFASRYGLRQIALESDGRLPTGRGMARAIEDIASDGARVLLVQPQHSSRQAQTLARELGLLVKEVDPLGADARLCMLELLAALEAEPDQGVASD